MKMLYVTTSPNSLYYLATENIVDEFRQLVVITA